MTEGNALFDDGDNRPYIEEAIIHGAQKQSKESGKPIISILEEHEKNAEKQEDFFIVNVYKKIKMKLFGN